MTSFNSHFNFFIGLDQTGAAVNGGRSARPLPFAFLDARGTRSILKTTGVHGTPLRLTTFSQDAIERLLVDNGVENAHEVLQSCSTAILADCVLGLPSELQLAPGAQTLRTLFRNAAADTTTRQGYGLKPAATFFAELRERTSMRLGVNRRTRSSRQKDAAPFGPYPVRTCERIANANSVFRTHPFQKNIQCGTYRFWRDLGVNGSDWVHLRYFETDIMERPFLFEAYPSLFWKIALGLKTRNRSQIREALKAFGSIRIDEADLVLITEDADHADAAVLAFGGHWLAQQNKLIDGSRSNDKHLAREGWIVGLKRKSPLSEEAGFKPKS